MRYKDKNYIYVSVDFKRDTTKRVMIKNNYQVNH